MTTKDKILEPALRIAHDAHSVIIEGDNVVRFAESIKGTEVPEHKMPRFGEAKRDLYFQFFLNSVNFCFWSKRAEPKWGIELDGSIITGYYAFAEAARRAFIADERLWNPDFLAGISFEDFKRIFSGQNELLLLPERHEIICENFEILSGYYAGDIERLARSGNSDINAFIENLARDFGSFQDKAECRGETLYFLKRAQLLAFSFSLLGTVFGNVYDLAVFSDYKLPQLLQAEGVLRYDSELLERIANEDLITEGSEEESEIRAGTVVACEMIRDELKKLERDITSVDLDFILWVEAKKREFTLPHHKTLTINY